VYGIAVSTIACLRGGTRVDVAWSLDPGSTPAFDPADALAFTPGGGRLGSLLGGAFDGHLVELAGVERTKGRVVELVAGPAEAPLLGVEADTPIRCLLTPATELPEELWPLLLERAPVALVARLDGDEVERVDVYGEATIDEAGDEVARRFRSGESTTEVDPTTVVTVLRPRPTLVVFGGGDIATAIGEVASYLGWATMVGNNAGEAAALVATLSALDGVAVLGHDSESTGRVLEAALSGDVGYIGSIGPRPVRDARDDWLAYRGVTDLDRVHSPAGLDIGARNPKEIALAVVGEMIAGQTDTGG
jgi:xanthine dehydrogenase accessory factor